MKNRPEGYPEAGDHLPDEEQDYHPEWIVVWFFLSLLFWLAGMAVIFLW